MRRARPVMPSRSRPFFTLAFMLALVGCQDERLPHFGELQYQSENLEIWASDGLKACGGTYEYEERWLAAFRQRVGDHGYPGRHTFYWLTDKEFEQAPCSSGYACTRPYSNVIYSTVIPIEHEIVHAELDSDGPSVFVEGAAEVFGSIEPAYTTDLVELDPLLDDERIPGVAYQTAGRFSRFIIEQHGLDAYFALFEALDGERGRDAIGSAVERILDLPLETLVGDFESAGACEVHRWRYFDLECSSLPLTPWQGLTRWVDDIDLSCAASDVIGPRDGLVWTLRALDVEQVGPYQLTIESTEPTARVDIFPCAVDCFDGDQAPAATASVTTGGRSTIFLTAGRHWLRVEHSDASDASVTVTIEP